MSIEDQIAALHAEIAKLTQRSIDCAVAFTRHSEMVHDWYGRCRELAYELLSGEPQRNQDAARTIMCFAFPDRPPAEFWRTGLGQRIWASGGFPPGGATRAEASAILGVTQQNVSYLVGKYRLRTTQAGRIEITSLMEHWRRRLYGPALT